MNIVVIGKGGHSKVIEDIIKSNKDYKIVCYLDDQYKFFEKSNGMYFGPIMAAESLKEFFVDLLFVIAIGNNHIRKSIVEKLNLPNHDYATLMHRKAVISPTAKIGPGTVVMASAVINADAEIGNHAIINTSAVIEHDNYINDFAHISPRATLTGSVSVGEGTHIGAGAVIIPGVQVDKWSVVGAGATVINNLPAYCTAVGNPARILYKEILGEM